MTRSKKNFLGLDCYQVEDNEPYMSPKQQAYFISLLKGWHDLLLGELDCFKHNLQSVEVFVDDADRASHEESQILSFRSSDRRNKLQQKIQEALNRINMGEYGYCKMCGEDIGIQRLEARPTADQCISCKTVSEIKEQKVGS